ncbi:MAG: DUF488 family protein [Betaproteobacteria bacterium]|nr:DUF488 family protein [Betaproteobacteria bacterium]
MKIHTIGFTKKSAEAFFTKLKRAEVTYVIDTRLHNTSQLSGFAKQDDLRYFLSALNVADYVHEPFLAPTDEMLDAYKKGRSDWSDYERRFKELMQSRKIEERLDRDRFDGACLLCSEDKPHHCHRRLVAEYLRDRWTDVEINHIV